MREGGGGRGKNGADSKSGQRGIGLVVSSPGLIANGLGFAAGVGALFLSSSLPPLWPSVLLAAPVVVVSWRASLLRPFAFAAVGFLWAWLHVCQVLCEPFPDSLVRRDIQLTGTIAGLPTESADVVRFLFRVEHARADGQALGLTGLVRLSWYRDAPALAVGERWQLAARLKPPHGFANPGGFDYEGWLFRQGVKATGYVRKSDKNQRLDEGPGIYFFDRWRQQLAERIGEVLNASIGAALVRALVLGDRSGLEPQQWEVLTRTGTGHLVAISGLHIGLVAAVIFFLARWTWACSTKLTLMIAAPRAAAVAALAGALAYSALAGFAVSTQRALIMLTVVLGAVVWARTLRPASGIILALVGVLILDPWAVLSPGFWLSFVAVAALLFALGQRLAGGRLWRKWGGAQWAVAIGLLPLLLLLFGRVSLIAPFINLMALPLFGLLLPILLLATLVGLVPGLELPMVLIGKMLESGLGLLKVASGWDWAVATMSSRPSWVWACGFAGAALLLAPRGLSGRWLGLVLLGPLVLVRAPTPPYGQAKFTLLDVGQGLAAVAQTRRHTLVYDTGPVFPSGFNTGEAVILPFLRQAGIGRIDTLIVSHGDRDHAGGLSGLNGEIPIRRMLSGEPQEILDARVAPCLAGERWSWDGVDFELLSPPTVERTGNQSSCVLRISTQGASVLLTGDIDKGVESELLAEQRNRLSSTLLVAAHHGSDTSTGNAFLGAVAPRFVLYSAGFANRFGFPSQAVRERVETLGAIQLDTASAGAISFQLLAKGLAGPWMFRQGHGRLWTHRVQEMSASF